MNAEPSRKLQRNFRKTPDSIARKLLNLQSSEIVVACAKKIRASEVRRGALKHLELTLDMEGRPVFPAKLLPAPTQGRFSLRNIEGHELVRRDLPKVVRTYSYERPNYGDWSKGSHEISWDRPIYQREYLPPCALELSITLLETIADEADPTFVFRFRVEHLLDRKSQTFDDDLFWALNLLQENTGSVDVFASDADAATYLKTLHVLWEILPPGKRTETINHVLSKFREPSAEVRERLFDRYNLLESLGPRAYISGISGFQRYFGAQYGDDLVVFENIEHGNAAYVMFENWEALSQMSRLELLKSQRDGFLRVVHRANWRELIQRIVSERRPRVA